MKLQRWADFFFVGVVVLPAVLLWMDYFDLGVLLLLPMLFVACGFGVAAREFADNEPAVPAKRTSAQEPVPDAKPRNFRNR
jgi:hypothetical protein